MKLDPKTLVFSAVAFSLVAAATGSFAKGWWGKNDRHERRGYHHSKQKLDVELGPRPYYLIDRMDDGKLKDKLLSCKEDEAKPSDFSIGHRGAPMQFPEHTKESYEAAARMGAGIMECDVAFTKDRELVCRHAQCDLHQTTNILATDLAQNCSVPPDMTSETPYADVQCCTHDFTLEQFRTLCGKMDGIDRSATTAEGAMNATADWRTDLYTTCGTLLSHAESIELFDDLDLQMTPELKTPPAGLMPYEGDFTQEDYAQKLMDEYKDAGIAPSRVWAQSFLLDDVLYWISAEPAYGKQAVFLDGRYSDPEFDHTDPSTYSPTMEELASEGVNIIAPPMWMLVKENRRGKVRPSKYARRAKRAGLDIIAWTFERSDLRNGAISTPGGSPTWYYQTTGNAVTKDADMYKVLDVLAQRVGILGIFSDWPATVTYYANCMDL